MNTTAERMSRLKDQTKELSGNTKKKKKEDIREKLENTEVRNRNANHCNSFRTKNNKQEKEDI